MELESQDFNFIAKMTHRTSHPDNTVSQAPAFFPLLEEKCLVFGIHNR